MKNLSEWDGSQKDQNLYNAASSYLVSTYVFCVKGCFSPFSLQADLSTENYGQIFETYNQDINMYTLARLASLKALSFDGLRDAHFLV